MIVLGIETSCDDTSAAVLRDDRDLLANVVASQLTHRDYGGVVPEIASRQHLKTIVPVVRAALDRAGVQPADLDLVAATAGPGLLGSLLVGLCAARAYAWGLGKPFVGVHHIEGHILANWLVEDMIFPCVVLVISGGHSQLIAMDRLGHYEELGTTRDDAAGEAFDKIGKMLGIPYPAGPQFERLAQRGDPAAVRFPRARLKPARGSTRTFDYSFSGLKTAARLMLQEEGLVPDVHRAPVGANVTSATHRDRTPAELESLPQRAYDILASAQEAIVDMLVDKLVAAVAVRGVTHVYLAGGVAANTRLREAAQDALSRAGVTLHVPPPRLCTDNGAMIACAGALRWKAAQARVREASATAATAAQASGATAADAVRASGETAPALDLDMPAFARGALQSWDADLAAAAPATPAQPATVKARSTRATRKRNR